MNNGDGWGLVCDHYWTDEEAGVACGNSATGAWRTAVRACASGTRRRHPVWLDDVRCRDDEFTCSTARPG